MEILLVDISYWLIIDHLRKSRLMIVSCMVRKLMVETFTKMAHFGTVSFTKHLYNTKQTSVVYK